MKLSDLDSKSSSHTIILLQTPSSYLSMFIEDKIKRKFSCKSEAIIGVETVSDFKKIRSVIGTTPPFSDKWFVKINLDKLYNKDLVPLIKQSNTCVFICSCSKYGTFKKFKEEFKGNQNFCDFYVNYLKRVDLIYLYDAFVPSDRRLSTQLFNYVVQGYSGDIEAIFKLFLQLGQGETFNTRKEIADLCGLGSTSIESYVFSLLKPLSGSAKGLDTVIKNRVKTGLDMIDALGISSFYNFMAKSLFSFCELKMLLMSGVVYKQVRNLPDSYDEKSLARYQKYLWKLKEYPMSSFLRLRQCMGSSTWRTETDFLNFIYRYYNNEAKMLLNSDKCSSE